MRTFFLEYQHDEFLAPLVREIGWTHNVLIMEKCKSAAERLFYITQTKRYHWTKSVLTQQLKARAYESTVRAQHNFPDTLPAAQQPPRWP